METYVSRLQRFMVPVLIVGLAWFAAAGCGDDADDGADAAAEITAFYADLVGAWNAEGFVAGWTPAAFAAEFGPDGAEFLPQFIGDPPITLRGVENIVVDGAEATAELEIAFGLIVERSRDALEQAGGRWRIAGSDDVLAPIPDDVTAVDLLLFDFAFGFDAAAIGDGNIAFAVENMGTQEHEVGLARVPADFAIADLLEADPEGPPPAGVEFLGALDSVTPGVSTNLVLAEPLAAGRYLMVCFLEDVNDPERTPHAFKGMHAEFTVR